MIEAQGQATGHVPVQAAIDAQECLTKRLQCIETRAVFTDMDTQTLSVPVFDHDEAPDPAILTGEDPKPIGGPHEIGCVRDNGAIVGRGRRLGYRAGESKWCSRISRRMRFLPTAIPCP